MGGLGAEWTNSCSIYSAHIHQRRQKSLLCILTSKWGLRMPFPGQNHFFSALKQVFLSFSVTNRKKGFLCFTFFFSISDGKMKKTYFNAQTNNFYQQTACGAGQNALVKMHNKCFLLCSSGLIFSILLQIIFCERDKTPKQIFIFSYSFQNISTKTGRVVALKGNARKDFLIKMVELMSSCCLIFT